MKREQPKRTLSNKRKVRGGKVRPRPASKGRLRAFQVGEGLDPPAKMMEELQDMTDVLMGRVDPPIDAGYLTLMEVADAYFARASEMTMLIHEAEREGRINKGSAYTKFRTSELREFKELAKRASELGSRRLTQEQLRYEMEQHGKESRGDWA